MSLIQWLPKIVQVTDEDIFRYGPNAAQVRALLDFIPGMSDDAHEVAWSSFMNNKNTAMRRGLNESTWNIAEIAGRYDARHNAGSEAHRAAGSSKWGPATDAAGAEVVSDLIDPLIYRILTNPFNAARVYDLRLPDAGSEFMRLTRKLQPISADDIERIADLSVDPRAQGIIEFLQGLQGNMPLAAKIDAARRLDRASRTGRRMQ